MTLEENKQILRRFFDEVCNDGKWDLMEEIFAPEFMFNGQTRSPDNVRHELQKIKACFENARVKIIEQFAEEDRVSTKRVWTAIPKSKDRDSSSLPKEITWTEISVVRLKDGKIVEDWKIGNDNSVLHINASEITYSDKKEDNMCGNVYTKKSLKTPYPTNIRAFEVKFEEGAYTKWHWHTGTQILIVADGNGFIEEFGKQREEIKSGDQIYIPEKVWHRHGAIEGKQLVHLAITQGETNWDKDDL